LPIKDELVSSQFPRVDPTSSNFYRTTVSRDE
jgi:hypothetical protein